MEREVKRGEIWWADLAEKRGSEPAFRRPVLVVQENALTDSRLLTVMVVPLTTNLKRAHAPGNVLLARRQTTLRSDSVALGCQIITLDKTFFAERVAALHHGIMAKVDAAMKVTLALH